MQLASTHKLSSGQAMPVLGFGVYKSPPEQTFASVSTALKEGYRHIDTAQYYENEEQVGQAVKASGIPRKDVFVTTKSFGNGETIDEFYNDMAASVDRIGLDGYVDLFLIHGPNKGPEGRERMWKALERLHAEGKAKSIGVSNYGVAHLEQMDSYAKVQPVCNQIEYHPWCQQTAIVKKCQEKGIIIVGYCPIARGGRADEPVCVQLKEKYPSKSVPQILLRWAVQKNTVPLPKSDNPERIKSNSDIFDFELSAEDVEALNALDVDEHLAPNTTTAP